ncbi:MAG TPA: winged helix-turn-helix domain-containing protein [Spirochaetales bacterium]|nr:winged helix-turn-helix domain-containing protein [Spirochaetales bacterium]HRY54908.1 winged helix-turn-helix domain-containing protein [Spirochaetia bacterium]HRZ63495.1 winged helix-turn-helix domain-containing protein [Spirochaetia bacterium]
MASDRKPAPGRRSTRLDPRNLKGLAHPLRVEILGSLRVEGPATASVLAARLGESSGATSYHLRQLASFGFVEEDPARGSARERWWRASSPSTSFSEEALLASPELGAGFLRSVAAAHAERALGWIEAAPAAPKRWRAAGAMDDWALDLDPAQARELAARIEALVASYPRFDPEAPRSAGRELVAVQLQILPRIGPRRPS